jgi:hypothetical protein
MVDEIKPTVGRLTISQHQKRSKNRSPRRSNGMKSFMSLKTLVKIVWFMTNVQHLPGKKDAKNVFTANESNNHLTIAILQMV